MEKKEVEYHDEETLLQGYLVYDNEISGKRPAVLVSHDWTGHNEFARQKAEKLAELGYIGFALDMFGKGILGKTNEEKSALIKPFFSDRKKLLQRINSALITLHDFDIVDKSRIGGIGFCFGGLCILDLARSGADLRGVVSFHGILNAPEGVETKSIKAKILALHGHNDPMAPPDQVLAFETEMTKAKVDWQVHVYGNTSHAFSNPQVNDPQSGLLYNPTAEKRAWISMKNFFVEVFN